MAAKVEMIQDGVLGDADLASCYQLANMASVTLNSLCMGC